MVILDPLMLQQIREWADQAAAEGGDVTLPGQTMVDLLDLLDADDG